MKHPRYYIFAYGTSPATKPQVWFFVLYKRVWWMGGYEAVKNSYSVYIAESWKEEYSAKIQYQEEGF